LVISQVLQFLALGAAKLLFLEVVQKLKFLNNSNEIHRGKPKAGLLAGIFVG
jgi:hypothetical protein